MKFIWIGVVLMALGANNAWAQSNPPPQAQDTTGSWVVGSDVGFKPSVDLPSIGTADGKSIDMTKGIDRPWSIYGGYKPVGHFGGEIRYKKFAANGVVSGSANGEPRSLMVWSGDPTPQIVTSVLPTRGPQNYTVNSSMQFSQADFLANRTWGLHRGAVSLFAGISIVNVRAEENITVTQSFLIPATLPNGSFDPIAIGEKYAAGSSASSNYRGVGPTIGAEGEKCIIGRLVFEGRGAITFLRWGSYDGMGMFTYTKRVDLVNRADGLNGPSRQFIANLNLAANQSQFMDMSKSTGTVVDIKAVLKWRFHLNGVAIDIGGGVSRTSFDGRGAPDYVIPGPFAAGQGKWVSQVTNWSAWTPMATINIWLGKGK